MKETLEQIIEGVRNTGMKALADRLARAMAREQEELAANDVDYYEEGKTTGYAMAMADVMEKLESVRRRHGASVLLDEVQTAVVKESVRGEDSTPQPPPPMYHVLPVDGDSGVYYWFYAASDERDVIEWLDELLMRTNGFSLLGELNDVQCECRCAAENGGQSFPDKFAIPLKILNYAIRPYGLRVERK